MIRARAPGRSDRGIERPARACQDAIGGYSGDVELRNKSIAGYSQLSRSAVDEFRSLGESHQRIFRFRFERNHGVSDERLWQELDRLSLPNAGPELIIPNP